MGLLSGGRQMMIAAVLAGGSFGAVATLIPIMTKKLSFRYMGTLYVSNKAAKPGQANCIGDECYRRAWHMVLVTSMPLMAFLVYWCLKALRRDLVKPKAE